MGFIQYDESRTGSVARIGGDAEAIAGYNQLLIDELFPSTSKSYDECEFAAMTLAEDNSIRLTAFDREIRGRLEYCLRGHEWRGRYTFFLINSPIVGDATTDAIYAIEFDRNGRLSFGVADAWSSVISENKGRGFQSLASKLKKQLLCALIDRLTLPQ